MEDEIIRAYFKVTGAKGGKARAERHSKEQISQWGKLGGRPKKVKPLE